MNTRKVLGYGLLAAIFMLVFAGCSGPIDTITPNLTGTVTITPSANVETGTELTAAYSGNESITLWQWKKDGANVGTNSNKYTPDEPGSYTVTVSATGYNGKTSAAVAVTNPAGNLNLAGTVSITPNAGVETGTELTAAYSGNESITPLWQWKKDGANVGTNSNKYTPDEPGSYTVTVSATGYNSKTSAAVAVTNPAGNLNLAGTVTITPNAGVETGTELTAAYSGNETVALFWQWKKDGANVGANSNKYTPDEPGSYTVTVSATGYNGKTSAAVAVTNPAGNLNLAGTVTITPSAGVETGTELTAAYSGNETVALFWQWKKDGANAGANSNKHMPTEAGSYTVTVSAAGYNSKSSAAVTVTAPVINPQLATPIADDYTVTGTGSFTYDGTAKAVTIIAKASKSTGNITILYNGNTAEPVNAGTYTVTFNIAAATGFNAVNGLAAGTLTIAKAVGAVVAAPTAASFGMDSVTLNAATAPTNGQTVEYARSGSSAAPVDGWQTGTTFSGLSAGTEYYFFARSASNANYETGAASGGTKIATTLQAGTGITIVSYWADDDGGISIGTGGGPIADNAVSVAYGDSVTFAALESGYTNQRWTLNGTDVDAGDVVAGEYTFATAGKEPGKNYIAGLRVQKGNRYYFTQITVKVEE